MCLQSNSTLIFTVFVFRELLKREKLDFYLSSALGVPLKDNKLQDIDDAHYVLTLDYTIKVCVVMMIAACRKETVCSKLLFDYFFVTEMTQSVFYTDILTF